MSGYIKQDGIEIINILNKDGEQTLATTGDQGVVVTGPSTIDNSLTINPGNNRIKFWEGSNSIAQIGLRDSGTGEVFLQGWGSDFRVAVAGDYDNHALVIDSSKHTDLYGNLTINKTTPVITLGVVNSSTGNSKIQFYSKNNDAANGYALQYHKDTNVDRLEFIDGSGNANIKFINGGAIEMISNKAISWGSGGSIRAEGDTLKLVATTLIDLQDNTQIQGTLNVDQDVTIVASSGSKKFKVGSTDADAGIYIDGSNGDFAGSDYFSLRQMNDKSIEWNARTGTGNTLFYSKGSLNLTMNGANAFFAGDITGAANFKATGNNFIIHAGGNHILNIDLNGKVYPQTDNVSDLGFSDSAYRFRNLYMTGIADIPSIYLHDYIYHKGDTDTYMRYQDNMITFRANGTDLLQMGRYPQSGGTYAAKHAFAPNGLIAPNLGGANMIKKGTDVAEAGIREEVEFMDGTKVQAHTSTGNGTSTACYNWYHSEFVKVDAQKDYEFSVWIKSTGDDHVYLGWHEAKTDGGHITSNPYFHTNKIKTHANNNNTSTVATNINGWTLLKFKLKSYRTSSSQNDTEGTDRFATNNRNQPAGVSGVTGVMHSTTSHVRLRLGSCYGSVNGSKTWFYNPKITEAQDNDYIHDLNVGEWSSISNLSLTGNLTFTNGSDILMPDNSGAALEFKQGTDLYMRFITTNGGEHIEVNKNIELQGVTSNTINVATGQSVYFAGTSGLRLLHDGTDGHVISGTGGLKISNNAQDEDIIFKGNDNGSTINALTLDMSDGGWATFNSGISVANTFSPSTFGGKVDIRGAGYNQIHIAHTTSADTNKQSGITTSNYEGNNVSIFQTFQQNDNNTIYFGSADGSHRGIQNYRFYVNTDSDAVSGHAEALHIGSNKAATFNGNTTINGDGSEPHSDNAFAVNRGSDGSVALRVQNSGEVVTNANYFYAAAGGTSMYVQNTAVFRGAILNDGSNAPVRIADNLRVEGDIFLPAVGNDLHLGDGIATTPKIRFGSTSWQNNIGIESYWMVLGCNQNEGFKFRSSNGTMLMQINGNNNAVTASDSMEAGPTSVVFPNIVVTKNKSYDYDATPPNQNLLDVGSIKIAGRDDIYGNATKTTYGDFVARYQNDNTGGTTVRIYVDDNVLVDDDTYMVSVYYENLIGTLGIDFSDTAVTGNGSQTGTSSAPKSGRIYGYASREDYNSTYRFVDINLSQGSGHEVTLHSPKVEAGTILTDFVALEREDIGSNSKNLKDLTVTNSAKFHQGLVADYGGSARFSVTGDVHVNGSTDLSINGASRRLSFTSGTGTIRTTTANSLIFQTNNTTRFTIANTGTVTATGDVVAYSDQRLKTDVKTLDGSKVYKMRGVSFIKDEKEGSGVIAQELEKVAPELVNNDSEYKSVAYGNITGYLIEAIKDLKEEIEQLKKQIK